MKEKIEREGGGRGPVSFLFIHPHQSLDLVKKSYY